MPNLFYILQGNSGATYILNAGNWNAISASLRFYRARNLKSKVLKVGLRLYLFGMGKLVSKGLKTGDEIQEYLQNLSANPIDFQIDENCSALISPTRNKIIVHHHGVYFQKFAFGESYSKVKNEANIYALFPKTPVIFQVSSFSKAFDTVGQVCSFTLSNSGLQTVKNKTPGLVAVLVEFFKMAQGKTITLEDHINALLKTMEDVKDNPLTKQVVVLESFKKDQGSLVLPLGLVHRDFKPWNILEYERPLIFDFEEAIPAGPPMEDLLNFYIDPIIRYRPTTEVAELLLSKANIESYTSYLKELGIIIDYQVLIHTYLIERIVFWTNAGELQTAKAYLALSDYLIAERTE